jgi:HK97 family phage prohead protease
MMPATATKQMEHFIRPFEVKASDDGAHSFTGLLAAWTLDQGNDVIQKGAFSSTLHYWRANPMKRNIQLRDNHNRASIFNVVGKMVDAAETEEGLETTWQMVPDDPVAEAAYRRIKGGFVTGMSIGYQPVKSKPGSEQGKSVRVLTEIKLIEGSLVLEPMNEDALVDTTSVKSGIAQFEDMTEEERRAFALALPDDMKAAIRAVQESNAPALAPEELMAGNRTKLRRLTLHHLASPVDPAGVGFVTTPNTMKDRTHGIDPGEARVA